MADWYDEYLKSWTPKPDSGAVEPLWSTTDRQGRTMEALLRYRGEYGVEAQILRDSELFIGRLFPSKELAVQWAAAERDHVDG